MLQLVYVDKKAQTGLSIILSAMGNLSVGKSFLQIN